MVFGYYSKLSRTQKAIYRKSDLLEIVPLPQVVAYEQELIYLRKSLEEEERKQLESVANVLMNALATDLGAPAIDVKVLDSRPSNDTEELHGLYEPMEANRKARISVWMRTAKHRKVVAFRSFLRTLLHEFCHHLDYEVFMLEESFHTEGFFKRESSLFKQLMGEAEK